MVVDRFTKFILSVISIFLCIIALNPWISPTQANAAGGDVSVASAINKLADGVNQFAQAHYKISEEMEASAGTYQALVVEYLKRLSERHEEMEASAGTYQALIVEYLKILSEPNKDKI